MDGPAKVESRLDDMPSENEGEVVMFDRIDPGEYGWYPLIEAADSDVRGGCIEAFVSGLDSGS